MCFTRLSAAVLEVISLKTILGGAVLFSVWTRVLQLSPKLLSVSGPILLPRGVFP